MPEVKVVNCTEPRTCSKCKKVFRDKIVKKRNYDVKKNDDGKIVSKKFTGTTYVCQDCYKK